MISSVRISVDRNIGVKMTNENDEISKGVKPCL